ncbi:hypothetical protein NKH41_28030 [Mesorhizobium sp. M1169]
MEPEEARKAFLAAAEEEGTLRSPLIRAGDWKFIKTRDRKLVTEEVPSNFHPWQPIGSPLGVRQDRPTLGHRRVQQCRGCRRGTYEVDQDGTQVEEGCASVEALQNCGRGPSGFRGCCQGGGVLRSSG